MKQIPNQFLMAVLTSLVGLLVTNAWLGYENIEQMRQGSLAASRNRSVIVALENIISLVTEAESVSVGEITASIAHEFNNPLGIILGFAEEVRSELPPGDHNHRALLMIEEETRRCQKNHSGVAPVHAPDRPGASLDKYS